MLVSSSCIRCPLNKTRRQVVGPEMATPNPRVLFLGRDPGEVEDKTGRPLHPTAPSGGLLRRMVQEAGIRDEWCAWDNVVHCHTPKNRGPRADEVLACSTWVRLVLGELRPEIVVVLGQEAMEAVTNAATYKPKKPLYLLGEWHGRELPVNLQYKLVAAYHPSGALRNSTIRRALAADLRVVARMLGVTSTRPEYTAPRPDCFAKEVVALDTETSKAGRALVVGLAYHCGDCGQIHGMAVPPAALRSYYFGDLHVVMHNAPFDMAVLEAEGLHSLQLEVEDTMVLAGVLGWRRFTGGSLGLKELAAGMLGLTWPTLADLGDPEDADPMELEHYCIQDAVATLMLWELGEEAEL